MYKILFQIIFWKIYSENKTTEMWSLKTGCLLKEVLFKGLFNQLVFKMWSYMTCGLSWDWSFKTGSTIHNPFTRSIIFVIFRCRWFNCNCIFKFGLNKIRRNKLIPRIHIPRNPPFRKGEIILQNSFMVRLRLV